MKSLSILRGVHYLSSAPESVTVPDPVSKIVTVAYVIAAFAQCSS